MLVMTRGDIFWTPKPGGRGGGGLRQNYQFSSLNYCFELFPGAFTPFPSRSVVFPDLKARFLIEGYVSKMLLIYVKTNKL